MTNTIIHVGDVGTVFELTIVEKEIDPITGLFIPINVSEAAVKKIHFQKPDKTKVPKEAEFTTDGSDGKIRYTSENDDIDIVGRWRIQGYVELIGQGKFYSEISTFDVQANIGSVIVEI